MNSKSTKRIGAKSEQKGVSNESVKKKDSLPHKYNPINCIYDLNPPMFYFTPNQETMQVIIRKACTIKDCNEIGNLLDKAAKIADKEFDYFE